MFFFTFFLYSITLKKTLGGYVNISNIFNGDGTKSSLSSNVINGHDASEGEFPFMAQIYHSNNPNELKYHCGGSLIGDQYIITAAHCLYNKDLNWVPLNNVRIVVGKNVRRDEENNHKLYFVKTVDFYGDPFTTAYDFAIYTLSTKVPESEASPIKIYPGKICNNIPVQVLGFGRVNPEVYEIKNVLQKANVDISSSTNCTKMNKHWNNNNEMLICQESKGINESNDSCKGDSGGPLITRYNDTNYLVGVVSTGHKLTNQSNTCGKNIVAYYARVGYYFEDIISITNISKKNLT
ncbi:hypothetical protein BB561_003138 [Smittium simulii]|uniref:Peptidase S1 domain-containing protein n=1 Tax=Smittium simulii TaxID=133385 RepID=A0A2T9YMZ0_9FUNG|nr:hypothetical protein BB561_003138 [Smittium simulii]